MRVVGARPQSGHHESGGLLAAWASFMGQDSRITILNVQRSIEAGDGWKGNAISISATKRRQNVNARELASLAM